jgi:hypothetical protein
MNMKIHLDIGRIIIFIASAVALFVQSYAVAFWFLAVLALSEFQHIKEALQAAHGIKETTE